MHLLFLIMTLAQAAKPPFCTQDLSAYPLPMAGGPLSAPTVKQVARHRHRPSVGRAQPGDDPD